MATLNIKNLSGILYRKLQTRARKNHRSVAQEVTIILEGAIDEVDVRSILELKGLGKERWHGVDAGRHVAEERHSWD